MDWHYRYKSMKKELNLNNSDIAKITGNTSDSVKSATRPSTDFPRNLKLAIVVFESMKLNTIKNIRGYIDSLN